MIQVVMSVLIKGGQRRFDYRSRRYNDRSERLELRGCKPRKDK